MAARCSVQLEAPTILRHRVRIQLSNAQYLCFLMNIVQIIVQIMYLTFELECEKNENKLK